MKSFIAHGGSLEETSLDMIRDKVSELEMEDVFAFLTVAQMKSDMKMTQTEADAVVAHCKRRGSKYYLCCQSCLLKWSLTLGNRLGFLG